MSVAAFCMDETLVTRAQFSAPPESLGVAEKRRFVALLSQKGGFLLKGAVIVGIIWMDCFYRKRKRELV